MSVGRTIAPLGMVMLVAPTLTVPPSGPITVEVVVVSVDGHSRRDGATPSLRDAWSRGAVARCSPHDISSSRAATASRIAFERVSGRPNIGAKTPIGVCVARTLQHGYAIQGATDVPDTNELIDEGMAAERLGMLDRAETCYALAASSEDPAVQATALTKLADVHRSRSEWESALDLARQAQDLARAIGERSILDEAIVAEG